jgi:hypothetical protein
MSFDCRLYMIERPVEQMHDMFDLPRAQRDNRPEHLGRVAEPTLRACTRSPGHQDSHAP